MVSVAPMGSSTLAFTTLFLSLVLGPAEVELTAGSEVAAVELLLDDRVVARREAPPWSFECDFGDDLIPHRLEAVAYDAEASEVARAVQWINLSIPPAKATLVVSGGDDGRAFARLTWASVLGDSPKKITVSLDGRELRVKNPSRIALPSIDPEALHFLRAELEFKGGVGAVVEAVFGGRYGDSVSTALTAFPVSVESVGETPSLDEVREWLTVDGRSVEVAAIELGDAEVIVVRDRRVQSALEHLMKAPRLSAPGRWATEAKDQGRFESRLEKDVSLGFFWPFQTEARPGVRLFPQTWGWLTHKDGGLPWLLANVPTPPFQTDQQLADAVAVAAMSSLSRNRRRAVVLILGQDPRDASRLTPRQAREYLETIRVPLFVWSPSPRTGESAWGEVADISTAERYGDAVSALGEALGRQRIVWLEGRHLPQRIVLSEEAPGVDLH